MTSARVLLRYRPGADVLTGTVTVPAPADASGRDVDEVVETPDADTTLTWRDGVLSSFQLVFAAARTGQGPLPIPAALWPTADTLIVTALHAVDEVADLGARMRARAEATCEVPVEALARPAPADVSGPARSPGSPHQLALNRRAAERLSRSLSRLADAVHTRVPVDDDVEALHTDHLARLLRELSTTLELHDTTAPGATAATRVAARAGETLKPAELELLETALAELDDPAEWIHAGESLDQLVTVLVGDVPGR